MKQPVPSQEAIDRRAAVIQALRDMADWLAENPGVPTPQSVHAQYSELDGFNGERFERVQNLEGVGGLVIHTDRYGSSLWAERRFAAPGVEYCVYAGRN